jgi:hypothetical protein
MVRADCTTGIVERIDKAGTQVACGIQRCRGACDGFPSRADEDDDR